VNFMPISIQDAISALFNTAVTGGKRTSTTRLDVLAEFCVQELEKRGLLNVETEVSVPGAGRTKQWDVAWKHEGKYRLAISLKSILRNISGTVPNRIDDMMGEVSNAQLYSPEIVIGYIMIFHTAEDSYSKKHGMTWLNLLQSRLQALSGRKPPSWTTGTIEAYLIEEVDFSQAPNPNLKPNVESLSRQDAFFDTLVAQVRSRNPGAVP